MFDIKILAFISFTLLFGVAKCQDYYDDEYDYGDMSINFDSVSFPGDKSVKSDEPPVMYPLCCQVGAVYNYDSCLAPPVDYNWMPKLDGVSNPTYEYSGFPVCKSNNKEHIDIYQKDVVFKKDSLLLPHYIVLYEIEKESYCITKILDRNASEAFQTKIFACLDKKDPQPLLWTCISIAHILLFFTLLTYFFVSELRCLQGQYIICYVISLLIYNLCLYPGSELTLDIADVPCIAIGAVKYFFFCSVFLWFNVICYDTWRTLSTRQDLSGRRRFIIYSAYSWLIGAILTTVVLVIPYTRSGAQQGSRNDPIKESNVDSCKLKMDTDLILQLAQLITMLMNLIFLLLASCCIFRYDKLGNGLLRSEASLCLKQSWKLFIIMIAHVYNSIDKEMVFFSIPMWQYILLEAVAIFGVFAYRRTIIRWCVVNMNCNRHFPSRRNESGTMHEKNHFAMT